MASRVRGKDPPHPGWSSESRGLISFQKKPYPHQQERFWQLTWGWRTLGMAGRYRPLQGQNYRVGGSVRPSQPQIQPTHQCRQDQWHNGEGRHSVPHTHSEWTTGAGGYVPVPCVPDYRRLWVYDGIPYQIKQRAGDRGITHPFNTHTRLTALCLGLPR